MSRIVGDESIQIQLSDTRLGAVANDETITTNFSDRTVINFGTQGDYSQSINKPQLNGHTINGSQNAHYYGIANLTDIEASYSGSISEDDWQPSGEYFFYTIPIESHNCNNPYVDKFYISNDGSFTNVVYDYNVLPNRSVRFRVDHVVNCEYKIKGER